MDQQLRSPLPGRGQTQSRRAVLRYGATVAAATALAGGTLGTEAGAAVAATSPMAAAVAATSPMAADGGALQPRGAVQAILDVLGRYPLVGLGERHMMQEMHDFITALLFHPDLPGKIDDIVVEFGTAYYQDLADRFILAGQPVARADLAQIWRQIGDPAWNAPVYEQFFHNVRALNWMLPPRRRIRVLLGQPPVTMAQLVAHPHDRRLLQALVNPLDDHLAAVVEREVLRKGRRALLITGGGHVLRGLKQDTSPPRGLSAAGQLVRRHPGALYVVDLLVVPPGAQQDPLLQRAHDELGRHPRPAIAGLAGTWLGALSAQNDWLNGLAYRAVDAAAARYGAQADAVLWLGPGEQLSYAVHWATCPPSWFSLFNQ